MGLPLESLVLDFLIIKRKLGNERAQQCDCLLWHFNEVQYRYGPMQLIIYTLMGHILSDFHKAHMQVPLFYYNLAAQSLRPAISPPQDKWTHLGLCEPHRCFGVCLVCDRAVSLAGCCSSKRSIWSFREERPYTQDGL